MELTADTPLPQLRDELQFLGGAVDGDGRVGFLIFDPVRHQYFRIGLQAAQAFGVWGGCTVGKLIEGLKRQGVSLGLDDVEALIGLTVWWWLLKGGQNNLSGKMRELKSRCLRAGCTHICFLKFHWYAHNGFWM